MAMSFRTIDLNRDLKTCIEFRRDSFRVSFGDEMGLNLQEYVERLTERIARFPWGYVMVDDHSRTIGQMELYTRDYDGRRIGFVSLYYLVPPARGQGKGVHLTQYAEGCFREQGVGEYHLRVSPTNVRAIRFYEKAGLMRLKEERGDHTVWRMGKTLT